jgi:hypothetical protein
MVPLMTKARRGFACMTLEDRRRIASLGGKAAQARAAGRVGGRATRTSRLPERAAE